MSQPSNDKAFKVICNFISDLADCFAVNIHSLALYDRLLTKTTVDHTDAVEKNITLFKEFVLRNKTTIIGQTLPFSNMVRYSEKVFLDMNVVMRLKMDRDTTLAIWNHLSVLLVMFDPESKSQIVSSGKLSPEKLTIDAECEEDEFLNKIISRVSEHVPQGGDAKTGLNDVLNSGLIPELVSDITAKMTSGNFDIAKMIASVEKLAGGSMGAMMDPQAKDMLSMLGNLKGLGGK